ncbi:MAG: 4Fe-4S binding protein [Candidatus Gastranaerophilales bacterium]|nr:4Fe-4S binding protein [Candidatus Gastranaerophilales bacterium]
MKEFVIISGKGGTGKTSITASLAALAKNKVMVDCDVDAADLHLILKPQIELRTDFYGGKSAEINQELCIKCGKCIGICKFDAVQSRNAENINDKFSFSKTHSHNNYFSIDRIKCEGCGVCYHFCPSNAIKFEEKLSGEWYESNTRFGKLIHAKLGVAEENSGKLVTKIRNHARLVAHKNNCDLIIVDGSPGIGCPVIASISGANLVLIVTEPSLSGIHDSKRVLELTQHFRIPACICINKFDINLDLTKQIEIFCTKNNIELVGKIPYSKEFTEAMIKELTLVEYSDGEVSIEIKNIWNKLENKLKERENV